MFEAGDILGHGAPLLLAFYLLVLCNFTPELVSNDLRELFKKSANARHAVGMVLLFFLVTLTNPDFSDISLLKSLITTVIIYCWFYLTTKCSLYVLSMILIALGVAYLANLKLRNTQDQEVKRKIKNVRDVAAVLSVVISAVGALISFRHA